MAQLELINRMDSFFNFKEGEHFLFNNEVFLKIETIFPKELDNKFFNAINIANGNRMYFALTDKVQRINILIKEML